LIVGAGFGWGVTALKSAVDCAAIGTDTSAYIHAEKDNDDRAEVEAAIAAVGLDPTTGRGLELLTALSTPGAKAKELILDEDLASIESRRRVDEALGGPPTWIVAENMVDDAWTDAEIVELAGHFDQSIARLVVSEPKVWLYVPTTARSADDLATLTGHKVIVFDPFPDLEEAIEKPIIDQDHGVVG
jgi:hypothetical protein